MNCAWWYFHFLNGQLHIMGAGTTHSVVFLFLFGVKGPPLLPPVFQLRPPAKQVVQRAPRFRNGPGTHVSVNLRGLDTLVTEEDLDEPEIRPLFHQVGCERMP